MSEVIDVIYYAKISGIEWLIASAIVLGLIKKYGRKDGNRPNPSAT